MTEQVSPRDESSLSEADVPYGNLLPRERERLMEDALQRGSTESLMKLFDDGIDIDQTDYEGRTALMLCVAQGRTEAVEVLLERGANVNHVFMYQGRKPFTALNAARQTGRTELEELLLSHGAVSGDEIPLEQPVKPL